MDQPTFLNDPLRNFDILKNLDDYQFAALKEIVVPHQFKAGEMIVEEGDKSDLLWFLVRGSIEIIKHDKTGDNEVSLTRIDDRYVFGEISFLHSYSRTASVRAVTDCGCVSLSRKDLEEKHPDGKHVLHEMTYQIARINTERVLDGDQIRLKNLRSEAHELRDRINYGKIALLTIFVVALLTMVGHKVFNATGIGGTHLFGLAIFGVALFPVLWHITKMGKGIGEVGITKQKFRRSLIEGAIAILIFGGLILGGLIGLEKSGLIKDFTFDPKLLIPSVESFLVTYLIYVFFQEFVCRGVVQTSLQEFLNDASGIRSVFITAVIFGLIQIPAGLPVVIFHFVAGIVLGFLYLRHHNLIGVTLFHYVVGLIFGPIFQTLLGL